MKKNHFLVCVFLRFYVSSVAIPITTVPSGTDIIINVEGKKAD